MHLVSKLGVITAIFQITNEKDMVNLAIGIIKKIDDSTDPYFVYKIIDSLYYLAKFNEELKYKLE